MCKGVKMTGPKTSSKTSLHSSGKNTVRYCIGTGNNLEISIYEELAGPIWPDLGSFQSFLGWKWQLKEL